MVKKLPTSIFCVAALLFTLNTVFSQNEKISNTSPDDSSKITKTAVFQYIENNFKIGGWIDAQYQYDNNWTESQSSVFQIRRARLDFKGSLSKWVDFRLQADFAPTPRLIDAFIKVNFCKYAKLQVGQFKIPFSLENILSPLDLELMENAQVISALSGYKDVTGISSYANGREIGAMLTGTLVETTVRDEKIPILRYGVGVFGGNGINVKTDNLAKDISARIEFCPFVKQHPAIISMETFEAAQKEFAERYGVKIMNGIAQRASYFYHRNGESGPHPKHRPPQWSEERRKSHSEYFRTRECGLCRYDFSHFIECENCGGHLQASLKHYVDGSSEVGWVDVEHTQRAKDTPRPLVFRDSALKAQIASALGWEAFSADRMFETLSGISVNVDMVTLHLKDGGDQAFRYIPPKQIHRKRKVET